MTEQKTTLVRINLTIYNRLQSHLKGKVPFKSASSFVGELILDALKTESQINAETKEEALP